MALRDTSWVLDTVGAVKTANAIVLQSSGTQDWLGIAGKVAQSYYRTRTTFTKEFINLTQAAAQRVVDTKGGDSNSKWQMSESVRYVGAYKLTQQVDSKGPWVLDT